MEINVKDARSRLSAVLDQVEAGKEVVILRRGKEVARLIPAGDEGKCLPALEQFRSTIRFNGEPLSDAVLRGRNQERY